MLVMEFKDVGEIRSDIISAVSMGQKKLVYLHTMTPEGYVISLRVWSWKKKKSNGSLYEGKWKFCRRSVVC